MKLGLYAPRRKVVTAAVNSAFARGWRRVRQWIGRPIVLWATLAATMMVLLAVIVVGGQFLLDVGQGRAAAPLPLLGALSGAGAPHFLFSINGVSRPLGVALSPSGDRVYVTEGDGERQTKVFDRSGELVGALVPPMSKGISRTPVYVAVSAQGEAYVSDRQAATIYVYGREGDDRGTVNPPAGSGGSWAPLALGFDKDDELLVTDVSSERHGVEVFGRDGNLLHQFGRDVTDGQALSFPNGIVADRFGRIVVSDSNNRRVIALDREGKLVWSIGGAGTEVRMGLPRGLAIDALDRLHVVDTISHSVMVFQLSDRGAKLLFTFGDEGIKDGEFSFPNGLALDRSERVYVTDRENNRVQVWTY